MKTKVTREMNLGDIVPPLHLCKKIPAGEFEDSCCKWGVFEGAKVQLFLRNTPVMELSEEYPAPMLEEILQELVKLSAYRIKVCKSWGEWHVDCYDNEHLAERDSIKNIATAALKLWLELKGIEA